MKAYKKYRMGGMAGATGPGPKKKYSEEQLLVWAAHASPVNPTEYGPLIKGKLNENDKLVAAYEKWMAENRPKK